MAVGIGVDYSIHYLTRYRLGKARGLTHHAAAEETASGSGKAIAINAISVAAGFLVLTLSSFVPLANLGILIALTMVLTALGSLSPAPRTPDHSLQEQTPPPRPRSGWPGNERSVEMKRIFPVAFAFLCLTAGGARAADIPAYDKANAATDGRMIADKMDQSNRPRQDLLVFAVMTLKSGDSVSDTRKVILKTKTYGDVQRALFRFMDSLKRGTTFLTIEHQGRDNEQYLYLPSMGRPRQVATADRQNDFEDTDVTNEELGGRKVDDYTYQRRKDETIRNREAYVVVAVSKNANARFPRYMAWVDRETFVPLQVKTYNKDNKLQKVTVAGDVRKVGSVHLPFNMVTKDLLRDHTTVLGVREAGADTGLNETLFDKNKMDTTWKENF